jgi:hypothetical protein
MPDPTGGILTGALTIGGSLLSSGAQRRAATQAGAAEERAAMMAIDEQRRQFDEMRRLLEPYVQAGTPALQGLMDLTGLGERQDQIAAIQQQEQNPLFQALAQQGEEALLQRASATGGLRGGNLQGALAQFRPQLLNQFIEQQYDRLGGLTSMGQRSAAGVGAAGMETGRNISTQIGNIGSAQAGAALARGQATSDMFGNIVKPLGGLLGGLF